MDSPEGQPLLREDRQAQRDSENDADHGNISRLALRGENSRVHAFRGRTQRFLTSKFGHYLVLILVSLDVSIIFADFLISLYTCEHSCGKDQSINKGLEQAQNVLAIVSLVFSCLFMVELLASIWHLDYSKPPVEYFNSKFHCFDAIVIIAGFVVDVCLKGVLEEVGSIVIVLRLWRVFKIIEEFSVEAEEQMDALSERIEHLEMENKELLKELGVLKGLNVGT